GLWGSTLFERILDDVADLGYEGIEGNQEALETFAREVARLRALLQERGLTLCAIPFPGHFFERDEKKAEIEALRRVADVVAEVSEGALVVFRSVPHPARRDMIAGHPPILPLSRDQLARLADTLNEYGDRCLGFGLRAAFQNRVGSYVETPDEFIEVVERTEPELVGLAPDVGHWAYAGGELDTLFRVYRRRLVYPRLKDLDQAVFEHVCEERLGFRHFLQQGGFTPLGAGSLALEPALMRLENANYAGWVCVDLEPTSETPRGAAEQSRTYLRERLHW
ncbi:MAG TPA: sugar phosphate isomerase/epimerase, partial [Chloroflexota bacterium]|nr:sugar phosphate isomerase/epimerase [Chloroflexota bacterium]